MGASSEVLPWRSTRQAVGLPRRFSRLALSLPVWTLALALSALPGWPALAQEIVLNEIDSDSPGTDSGEFIELYGPPLAPLDGLVLVFYNGGTDTVYRSLGLTGRSLDANGFFLLGNPAVPGAGLTFPNGTLQNGPDAVALCQGSPSDFPVGAPASDRNLLDAVVYGTADPPDQELLVLLTPGEAQLDESGLGQPESHALARVPDGGLPRKSGGFRVQAPTPGSSNAPAPPAGWVLNEVHADPHPTEGDANGDGVVHSSQDEFIEIVNTSGVLADLSGWTLADQTAVRHRFPTGTWLPRGCALVVFGGGTPRGHFGGSLIQTASSGSLGLNNSGDTVTLSNGLGTVTIMSYGAEGGHDASLTRSPDLTGTTHLRHDTLGQPFSVRFSPGLKIDGSLFPGSATAAMPIARIQGAGHRSALVGQAVDQVEGIVTAVTGDGFFVQDLRPDGDPATSEALLVRPGPGFPSPDLGRWVRLSGIVEEFREGAAGLSVTGLREALVFPGGLLSLPEPLLLGRNGRRLPDRVLADDAAGGDLENPATLFDPESDGLDFFESLEGMRVQVEEAVVVGPTGNTRCFTVVGDAGAGASGFCNGRHLRAGPEDHNPERILVAPRSGDPSPLWPAGARLQGPLVGIIHYLDAGYRLQLGEALPAAADPEPLPALGPGAPGPELRVATFNCRNLGPDTPPERLAALAQAIVTGLAAPDLLALQEIQDDSGPLDDGVTSARETFARLGQAIRQAGGPEYASVQIAPLDGADGGTPGANIRSAFLYLPERLSFLPRPGGDALTPVRIESAPGGILSCNPGLLEPQDPAFLHSRKPLVAQFQFRGQPFLAIACHLVSRLADGPSQGRLQPPPQPSAAQRLAQAAVISSFVRGLLAREPEARVMVLGDLNDYEFGPALARLREGGLVNLAERLPAASRVSHLFEGQAGLLDHLLLSPGWAGLQEGLGERVPQAGGTGAGPGLGLLAGFAEAPAATRASDHNPLWARLRLPERPPAGGESVAGPLPKPPPPPPPLPPQLLSGPALLPAHWTPGAFAQTSLLAGQLLSPGQAALFAVQAESPQEAPLTVRWDFGDGTQASGSQVPHRYEASGEYTVTVTVINPGGSLTQSLRVQVARPLVVRALRSRFSLREQGADRLELEGVLPDLQRLSRGARVALDIGGVGVEFRLGGQEGGFGSTTAVAGNGGARGAEAEGVCADGVERRRASAPRTDGERESLGSVGRLGGRPLEGGEGNGGIRFFPCLGGGWGFRMQLRKGTFAEAWREEGVGAGTDGPAEADETTGEGRAGVVYLRVVLAVDGELYSALHAARVRLGDGHQGTLRGFGWSNGDRRRPAGPRP